MTIAFWCVLVAALLPYLGIATAKAGGRMPLAANHGPREWVEQLSGWKKRAYWYQNNSFEAFPAFAAAVLIATYLQAEQSSMDRLAMAFIGFRIAHFICYLADWATARSLVWFGGLVCVVWLFVLGA